MINRKIYLFILLIVLLVSPRLYAQDNNVAAEEIVKKNEPIEIDLRSHGSF